MQNETQKQRARYLELKKQVEAGRLAIRKGRAALKRSVGILKKISPQIAKIFGKSGGVGLVRMLFMSPEARKRYLATQIRVLQFVKKMAASEGPIEIPKNVRAVLTRSQLKLLLIIMMQKKLMMEEVLMRERRAIARARAISARPEAPEIDPAITPELTDMVKSRLGSYRLKMEEAAKKAQSKWASLELDRFKANIEYERGRARSLWQSRFS